MTEPVLGTTRIGDGPRRVVVLNDWLSDTTSWAPAWPILDQRDFTWIFADLRGYGRSRSIGGAYTLGEAASDVLRLADSLGWERFSLVGHSMSSLVTLHLAQSAPDRIERAVVLAPPPPAGLQADAAALEFLHALAEGGDEARLGGLAAMWGERLGPSWRAYKVAQWRAAAVTAAARGYVSMFAHLGLPGPRSVISLPVLAVTGEEDAEIMRAGAVEQSLSAICTSLKVAPLLETGHYPMQECPPRLVEVLEQFLGAAAAAEPA